MKSSALMVCWRFRGRKEKDHVRDRMAIGRKPCSCSLCLTSSVFCPTMTALTTSPVAFAYLTVNSINFTNRRIRGTWGQPPCPPNPFLLPDPFDHLYAGWHFEIELRRLQARIGPNIRKDELGSGSIGVIEQKPPNLEILRVDLHDQFLEIRLSLRTHPN